MDIILGGTGHVGGATARVLLRQGRPVTIVTRDPSKGAAWERSGAIAVVADVRDVARMRDVLRGGTRLFMLNPPAAPSTDTDVEERETVAALLAAIQGASLDHIVAESTYGAQPGERCGDLNVLYEMEEGLRRQPIPSSIIRAAYYMSNWEQALPRARDEGLLPTLFPADFLLPMVSPDDLGEVAARLLIASQPGFHIHPVEGPRRYTPADVASAFAQALGRDVRPQVTPRDEWYAAYRHLGFSNAAARSYERMTDVTLRGDYEMPTAPIRGATTLQDYVRRLVAD